MDNGSHKKQRGVEEAFDTVGDYADKLKDVLDHSWEINHSCWDNAYNPCEDTDFGKDTEAIFWEDTGNYRGNVQTVSESL